MRSNFNPASPRNPHNHWIGSQQLTAFRLANTTAHRLYSSADGWLERFGPDLLLSYKNIPVRDEILAELPFWSQQAEFQYERIYGKFLPKQNQDRIAPTLLSGPDDQPVETVVQENGMFFGLDFAAGYSAGLFLDQRANRAFLRRLAPRRLLNTFAYTCTFSVAAALSGAETVSVDLSKKSLDRGRDNFALNQLDPSGHRFLADDVLDVLPRLARRNEQFDAIVLDPPTFSRGNKGRKFQVEQHFEDLLLGTLSVAAPRSHILLSTNCTRLSRRALESIARFCLKANRLSGTFHQEPALPDIPPEFAAQTLWLILK